MALLISQLSSLLRENKFYFTGISLFAAISVWLSYDIYLGSVSLYSEAEKSITELQNKRKSISGMMRHARERTIILLEMHIEQDVFERYSIMQNLNDEALNFVAAKNSYETSDFSSNENLLFEDILEIVNITAPIQIETAQLLIADEMQQANNLLFGQALPNQTQIMEKFEILLNLVEQETEEEITKLNDLLEFNNKNVIFLILLVITGTIVSFSIITSRSIKRENDLRKLVDARTCELNKAHTRTKSLIDNASDGIVSIDEKQNIVIFNPAAEKMFQYHEDEILGKPLSLLLPDNSKDYHPAWVNEFSNDNTIQSRMMDARPGVLGKKKDGKLFPAEVSISKARLGKDLIFTAFIRDVTEKRDAEDKMRKLAMCDSLTGLYNRHHFENRLKKSIKYLNRFPDQGFCLMLLDLDLFKQVNDTYGHPTGDKLLKRVASILLRNVREIDDIGRLGGDEFAIILQGIRQQDYAAKVAEKLIIEISQPHSINEHEVNIGISIGITFCKNFNVESEELFKQADKMLYAAKNAGKNTYKVFPESKTSAEVSLI